MYGDHQWGVERLGKVVELHVGGQEWLKRTYLAWKKEMTLRLAMSWN
jgi:hypothetical protein